MSDENHHNGAPAMAEVSHGSLVATYVGRLEFGIGFSEPPGQCTDEELRREVEHTQEPVTDPAIVCIDVRRSVGATHGSSEPVRRKSAGGAGMSGFEGAILADWYLLATLEHEGRPTYDAGRGNEVFDYVAEMLAERGVRLGAHVDNHTHQGEDATHCGATDGAPAGNQRLAELGHSVFEPVMATLMADDFDAQLYDLIVMQAQRLEANRFFEGWSPTAAHKKVTALGGHVETLDADINREKDPDNIRHGHWAEGVNHGTAKGYSNNRDAAKIPYYQLDREAVWEIADKLGRNDYEKKLIRHGIYAYNVAITYGLTKNQRVTQTEQATQAVA